MILSSGDDELKLPSNIEPRVPTPGDVFNLQDFEMFMQAVHERREKFPDEDSITSWIVVMLNIGDRFTRVKCTGPEEWTGMKKDAGTTGDLPTCPDGHALHQGPTVCLGWVIDTEV